MTELDLPYQREGIAWLANRKYGLLADEPGLGKTLQCIRAVDTLPTGPGLVCCPAVARINWSREFAKFSKHGWTGTLIQRASQVLPHTLGTVVCSFDLLSGNNALLATLSTVQWRFLVIDEAHYLKSLDAKRSAAILGRNGLVHRAERVWLLTGTPAPNDPSELWTILFVFGVTRLSYDAFVERYCTYFDGQFGRKITGGKNIPELRELIAPFMLRRKKVDVMKDLPKITFEDVVVEGVMPPQHKWEKYFSNFLINPRLFPKEIDRQATLVEQLTANIGLGADGMNVLKGLQPQVKTLRQWTGIQKVPPVLDIVRAELASRAYDKIVIFAYHLVVIEELREGLRDFGVVAIYGGTPDHKRDTAVRKFQTQKTCRVFIGQVLAAGVAITLTAAHQVMFVEQDWVPANNFQAALRVHRIGQTMPVTVRVVSLADSYDERIQKTLKRKLRTLTELFDPEKPQGMADPSPLDIFS